MYSYIVLPLNKPIITVLETLFLFSEWAIVFPLLRFQDNASKSFLMVGIL